MVSHTIGVIAALVLLFGIVGTIGLVGANASASDVMPGNQGMMSADGNQLQGQGMGHGSTWMDGSMRGHGQEHAAMHGSMAGQMVDDDVMRAHMATHDHVGNHTTTSAHC